MTCMSEEQRYSKEGRAGWDPAVGQGNKGEKRQNAWTANLRKILQETSDLDGDVRNILDTIQEHENIPRKKPKFVNFVKNIMRNRARPHSIDKTWELFEQALKPPAAPEPMEVQKDEPHNGESDKIETNGKDETPEKENEGGKKEKKDKKLEETTEDVNTKPSSRKRKSSDRDENEDGGAAKEEEDDESPPKKVKFDWDEVITACLKEKDGNEMKLVKLKKKCLREYFSAHEGTHKSKEEVGAKFDKKMKNKSSYKVLKDRIKLVGVEEEEKKGEEEEEEVMQGAPTKPEGWQSAPEPKKPAISFNKWEGADMGSDAQTEKFRRLMGIKAAPKPKEVVSNWGRDDKKMLRDLEQGFEKARETHFGGRSFTQ